MEKKYLKKVIFLFFFPFFFSFPNVEEENSFDLYTLTLKIEQ